MPGITGQHRGVVVEEQRALAVAGGGAAVAAVRDQGGAMPCGRGFVNQVDVDIGFGIARVLVDQASAAALGRAESVLPSPRLTTINAVSDVPAVRAFTAPNDAVLDEKPPCERHRAVARQSSN